MKRWLMTMMVLTLSAGMVHAETWDGRWGLGLEGGVWKQIHGDHDYSNVDQFAGIKLRHGLSEAWTLDLGFKYGWTRPGVATIGEDAGFTFDSGAGLYTRIWQPSLTGTYRLVTDGTWRPWVSFGAGVTRWDVRDLRAEESVGLWPDGVGREVYDEDGTLVNGHGVNVTAIVGLGTEIVASNHWSFDLGVRYNYLLGQDKDSVGMSSFWGADNVDANTAILEGLVGVNYIFGSTDNDGDGIPNDRDADPDNPEDFDGFRDDDGAPDPDNDNDGVLDINDGAPDDAEDRDGFQDEDGVPDPDNDGDGVIDARDGAPTRPRTWTASRTRTACPIPTTTATACSTPWTGAPAPPRASRSTPKGCPVAEEIRADLVLEGVNFKSGSAELTAESATVLDQGGGEPQGLARGDASRWAATPTAAARPSSTAPCRRSAPRRCVSS